MCRAADLVAQAQVLSLGFLARGDVAAYAPAADRALALEFELALRRDPPRIALGAADAKLHLVATVPDPGGRLRERQADRIAVVRMHLQQQ